MTYETMMDALPTLPLLSKYILIPVILLLFVFLIGNSEKGMNPKVVIVAFISFVPLFTLVACGVVLYYNYVNKLDFWVNNERSQYIEELQDEINYDIYEYRLTKDNDNAFVKFIYNEKIVEVKAEVIIIKEDKKNHITYKIMDRNVRVKSNLSSLDMDKGDILEAKLYLNRESLLKEK